MLSRHQHAHQTELPERDGFDYPVTTQLCKMNIWKREEREKRLTQSWNTWEWREMMSILIMWLFFLRRETWLIYNPSHQLLIMCTHTAAHSLNGLNVICHHIWLLYALDPPLFLLWSSQCLSFHKAEWVWQLRYAEGENFPGMSWVHWNSLSWKDKRQKTQSNLEWLHSSPYGEAFLSWWKWNLLRWYCSHPPGLSSHSVV